MLSVFEYSYFEPGVNLTPCDRTQLMILFGETKPVGSFSACFLKPSDSV